MIDRPPEESPPAPPTGPFLRVLEGQEPGRIVDLAGRPVVVFGGPGSDEVVVEGAGALCRFREADDGDGIVVEDLTGRGVLVNHLHDTDARLTDGDLIVAGDVALLFDRRSPAELPPAFGVESGRVKALHLIEVPRLFHSVYREAPFTDCLVCGRSIESGMSQYFVEKVFRRSEVIMECAICLACMQDMQSEFSEESREALEAFGRQLDQVGHSFVRCDLCRRARAQTEEYNLICGCLGHWMIREAIYLLCDACVHRIQELLSRKTREIHGDFLDTHFPGVPHDLDIPSPMLL